MITDRQSGAAAPVIVFKGNETQPVSGLLRVFPRGRRDLRAPLEVSLAAAPSRPVRLLGDSSARHAWLPPGKYRITSPDGGKFKLYDSEAHTETELRQPFEIEGAKELLLTLEWDVAPPKPQATEKESENRGLLVAGWAAIIAGLLLIFAISAFNYLHRIQDTVLEPGGTFVAGNPDQSPMLTVLRKHVDDESFTFSNVMENPITSVHVGSFYLDKHEVSVADYANFLRAVRLKGDLWGNPLQPAHKDHTPSVAGEHANDPVRGVDYFDAYDYARWAGKRLPTGNEFERACRGPGSKRLYAIGDVPDPNRANIGESNTNGVTPVTDYAQDATPDGITNLMGNVSEILDDNTPDNIKQNLITIDVRGGDYLRSGALLGLPWVNSVDTPDGGVPPDRVADMRIPEVGFRCAMDAKPGSNPPEGMALLPACEIVSGPNGGPHGTPTSLTLACSSPFDESGLRALLGSSPHTVHISTFRISKYAVSVAQYRAFLSAQGKSWPFGHPAEPKGTDHQMSLDWLNTNSGDNGKFDDPMQPAVGMTWWSAYAYAHAMGMDLPTADQWEYVVRGDADRRYPFGDTWDPSWATRINCLENKKTNQTLDVDNSQYEQLGITHLVGNCNIWLRPDNGSDVNSTFHAPIAGGDFMQSAAVWAEGFARDFIPADYQPSKYGGKTILIGVRLITPAYLVMSDVLCPWQAASIILIIVGVICLIVNSQVTQKARGRPGIHM